MINSANHYTVSDILKTDAPLKYVVPKYQREYIWGKRDWENLFDDVFYNDPGHFLGSIICINRSTDALTLQEMEIVDGQQRLTTLSLLYAAIYSWLSNQEDLSEDEHHELLDLRLRLVLKTDRNVLRVEPSYQGQNNEDYRAKLAELGLGKDVEAPSYAGNRRIYRAFNYFLRRLDEVNEQGGPVFDRTRLQDFLLRVGQASLVKIEVSSHSDAFTLFESLNNRGVPLSAVDLIKNKLLAALEKKDIASIDENFDRWNSLLRNLGDDYTVQERFLRHYYNAFIHDEAIHVSGVSLATRSTIIKVYEELIDRDVEGLFQDLHEKAKLYGILANPEANGGSQATVEHFLDLERIGGAQAHVLLLYLMSRGDPQVVTDIAEFLVRYTVRRNLTDTPPTRDVPRIFMDLTEELRQHAPSEAPGIVRRHLTAAGNAASDDGFFERLKGDIYEDNTAVARFVLCRIEREQRTKETMTDLWARDRQGKYIWTVEHIFPQGQNIPRDWVNMISGGDAAKASQYRAEYVHKLGNLTLTGYNPNLGAKSFLEKRDRRDRAGKEVGYRNGLSLNHELVHRDRWRVEDIQRRTDELANMAMELFKL